MFGYKYPNFESNMNECARQFGWIEHKIRERAFLSFWFCFQGLKFLEEMKNDEDKLE